MQTKHTHTWLLLFLVTALVLISGSSRAQSNLAPSLEEIMAGPVSSDSMVKVVILLEDNDRQSAIKDIIHYKKLTRAERFSEVTNRLRFTGSQESKSVESFLDLNADGDYVKHWIVPAYSAVLSVSAIRDIAALDGVVLIAPDARVTYDPPVATSMSASAVEGVSNHLAMLKVPRVWAKGYTGKGRLVCNFDTGVELAHPALYPKWIGHETGPESGWFSTVNPDSLPVDKAGHGTHTMGVMVGSIDADSFGVAPDARWMAAGVIDQGKSLGATFSDILGAYEWALNPDGNWSTTNDVPDVILNSWGVPKGMFQPCDDLFWSVIDNVEAAGVVTIFAAGNEGPDPMTIRSPADRATTPFNTFSVGAVDDAYGAASFSSRGPSSCDLNRVKPEVMAPGVGIRSSTKNGGFLSMSGTSMAAPYIAGLVALARQYNPDATPEEIKEAMILSAIDLGPAGEDNTYGYGFVDAELMLDYLPVPVVEDYSVTEIFILNGAELGPGNRVELMLIIANPAGVSAGFYGTIVDPNLDGVHIEVGRVQFTRTGDITQAFNLIPFVIAIDAWVPNGLEINTPILIESSGGTILDSVRLVLQIGVVPPGELATYDEGTLSFSVSDYGQLGLAEGSIYNAGGLGLRFNGSANLLYEAGIVIGQGSYNVSSSLRDRNGNFRPSDFTPVDRIATEELTTDGGNRVSASFADQINSFGLPLEVQFEAIDYSKNLDENMVVLSYDLVNVGTEPLDSVYFGFLADFDLLGRSETIHYLDSVQMIYQVSPEGPLVGVVLLENLVSATTIVNGTGKAGLSEADYLKLISGTQIRLEHPAADDLYFVIGSGPLKLAPEQAVRIKMALIAGDNVDELTATAQLALDRHSGSGGTTQTGLPDSFELYQNYPNPFNPSTTIALVLSKPNMIRIDIINILGQTVKQFDMGLLPAGRYEVIWEGRDDTGEQVASGVYFYRVADDGTTKTRKMVLLR